MGTRPTDWTAWYAGWKYSDQRESLLKVGHGEQICRVYFIQGKRILRIYRRLANEHCSPGGENIG